VTGSVSRPLTIKAISHSRQEESSEAKARWFQSLSLSERMDYLCFFTDLILQNNPKILEKKNAQPAWGRFRVLSKTSSQKQSFFVVSKEDLIASKRAAGREVDLEDVRLLELDDD